MTRPWTPEAIRALGATTDLPTLGSILGVSRWKAYKMAQAGEWEEVGIRIVPIGTKYRVAVQSILDVLGNGDVPGTDTDGEIGAALRTQSPANAADGTLTKPSGPAAIRNGS